jgi:hypothetical protein
VSVDAGEPANEEHAMAAVLKSGALLA